MARIEFPLEETYQADEWGVWEMVRELVVNAKDGERRFAPEDKGQMCLDYSHTRGQLNIQNKRIKVPVEALLIGWSESRSREECVGQFGEGLVMALLTAARLNKEGEGIEVSVYNQDEAWYPAIEPSQKGFKANVLVIRTRKLKKRRLNFTVRVKGLTSDLWEEFRHLFLWSDPEFDPDKAVKPEEHTYDRILMQAQYKGLLFVKGVFVKRYDELAYGYDLAMKLNRDRKMVNEWDLKWQLNRLLSQAVARCPDEFKTKVYDMLERGDGLEVGSTYSMETSPKVIDATVEQFEAKYGEEAVPVANMSESRELEHVGKKGVVVSQALRKLVEQRKGNFQEVKTKAAKTTVTRYSWSDLNEPEKEVLDTTCKVLHMSPLVATRYQNILDQVNVVDFMDKDLMGRYLGATGDVELAKSRLEDLHDTVSTMIHEVAHVEGDDGSHDHAEAQLNLATSIILALVQRLKASGVDL